MHGAPQPGRLHRILLVDDEIHLTNLWRLILEITGRYVVQEEHRGNRVLQTARKFHPDLIFMDRNLPDADGDEVAARLRADAELKSVPIVFVTGEVTREEAALESRVNGLPTLAKPFGSDELPLLADAILNRENCKAFGT